MKRFKSWLQQSWAPEKTPRREKHSPAFPPPLLLTHLRGSGLRRSSSLAAGGGCGAAGAAGGRCGRAAGGLSGAWRGPYTCPSVSASVSVRVSTRGSPSERRGCAGGAGPGPHLKPPAGSAVPSPAPIPARPVPSHPRPPLGVTGPGAGSPEEESEGRAAVPRPELRAASGQVRTSTAGSGEQGRPREPPHPRLRVGLAVATLCLRPGDAISPRSGDAFPGSGAGGTAGILPRAAHGCWQPVALPRQAPCRWKRTTLGASGPKARSTGKNPTKQNPSKQKPQKH